jgi:hypothetical protein
MQQRSVVSSIYPCQILTASFIYFLGILFGCIIYSQFQLTYTRNNIDLMRYIYLSKHLKAHLVSESLLCDTAVLLLYVLIFGFKDISQKGIGSNCTELVNQTKLRVVDCTKYFFLFYSWKWKLLLILDDTLTKEFGFRPLLTTTGC